MRAADGPFRSPCQTLGSHVLPPRSLPQNSLLSIHPTASDAPPGPPRRMEASPTPLRINFTVNSSHAGVAAPSWNPVAGWVTDTDDDRDNQDVAIYRPDRLANRSNFWPESRTWQWEKALGSIPPPLPLQSKFKSRS